MREQITITLKIAHVNAFIVQKGTKKPISTTFRFPVTFRDNRDFTESEIEEMSGKRAEKQEARLAWVENTHYTVNKLEMDVADFIKMGKPIVRASKADGGTGRTREPIISREIGASVVVASIVYNGQKKPVQKAFTFGEIMTEAEAEKAIAKAGKKGGYRLCWVDEIKTDSKLFAVSLHDFVESFNWADFESDSNSDNDSMNA